MTRVAGNMALIVFIVMAGRCSKVRASRTTGWTAIFPMSAEAKITGKDADAGKIFALPSLRNVAITAPYMHDGRFQTLAEVVEHYCTGVRRSTTLDPNLAEASR